MKESKVMREIHEIMEKVYEEEKHLTPEQRIKRIHEESERFLRGANLKLKRVEKKPIRV